MSEIEFSRISRKRKNIRNWNLDKCSVYYNLELRKFLPRSTMCAVIFYKARIYFAYSCYATVLTLDAITLVRLHQINKLSTIFDWVSSFIRILLSFITDGQEDSFKKEKKIVQMVLNDLLQKAIQKTVMVVDLKKKAEIKLTVQVN